MLVRRNPQLLHARLTGQLDRSTVVQLGRAAREQASASGTVFVVLDATLLEHISLAAARAIASAEPRWRDAGIVAVWVGLDRYLVDVMAFACGNEQQVPALADWPTAQRVLAEVLDRPAPVARGRLMTSSALVH